MTVAAEGVGAGIARGCGSVIRCDGEPELNEDGGGGKSLCGETIGGGVSEPRPGREPVPESLPMDCCSARATEPRRPERGALVSSIIASACDTTDMGLRGAEKLSL